MLRGATRRELTWLLGVAWQPTGKCRLGADDASGPASYRRVAGDEPTGEEPWDSSRRASVAVRLGGPGVPLSSSGPGGAGLPRPGPARRAGVAAGRGAGPPGPHPAGR